MKHFLKLCKLDICTYLNQYTTRFLKTHVVNLCIDTKLGKITNAHENTLKGILMHLLFFFFFFFFFFFGLPTVCRSFLARDQTRTTAVTQVTAVTTRVTHSTEPPGKSKFILVLTGVNVIHKHGGVMVQKKTKGNIKQILNVSNCPELPF